MSKKKKIKYFSILSKQKPKKRKNKVHNIKILAFCIFTLAMFSLVYVYRNIDKDIFSFKMIKLEKVKYSIPQIVIKPEESGHLSDDIVKKISDYAYRIIKDSNQMDFEDIAKKIQNNFKFTRVHIFQSSSEQLVIFPFRRKAVLTTSINNKTYFISDENQVFESEDISKDNLVKVSNIVERSRGKLKFDEDNSLELESEEEKYIQESLVLYHSLIKNNFEIKQIDFNKYRGFYVTINNSEIEVILGRMPFDQKIKRLLQIIELQKSSGTQISKIELDYEGKAFIKEQKI